MATSVLRCIWGGILHHELTEGDRELGAPSLCETEQVCLLKQFADCFSFGLSTALCVEGGELQHYCTSMESPVIIMGEDCALVDAMYEIVPAPIETVSNEEELVVAGS